MNTQFLRQIGLILFIISLHFAQECNKQVHRLPDQAFKHWVHSFEEDKNDIQVFRPVSYRFPPALGRDGFEFKAGNEYIGYRIGPADGIEETKGSWALDSNNQLKVKFQDSLYTDFELEIIEVSDTLLRVRKLQSSN